MSSHAYSLPSSDVLEIISDIMTLFYVSQRNTFPKFVPFGASNYSNPATISFMLSGNALNVECADPVFVFPDDLTVDQVQLAAIAAERKRVESFREKDDQMKLTILALINLVDPSITTFDQAFTILRTKTAALAANPLNAQYLTIK